MNLRICAVTLAMAYFAFTLAGCSGGASNETPAGSASSAPADPAAGGLAAVSSYDSGPRASESPVDPALAETGEGLFKTKGCTACHGFGQKLTGPDLAGVAQRRTTAWMEQQILHPDVMTKTDPISHEMFAQFALQMPNQGLTAGEATAVIEYLKHKDQELAEKQ